MDPSTNSRAIDTDFHATRSAVGARQSKATSKPIQIWKYIEIGMNSAIPKGAMFHDDRKFGTKPVVTNGARAGCIVVRNRAKILDCQSSQRHKCEKTL